VSEAVWLSSRTQVRRAMATAGPVAHGHGDDAEEAAEERAVMRSAARHRGPGVPRGRPRRAARRATGAARIWIDRHGAPTAPSLAETDVALVVTTVLALVGVAAIVRVAARGARERRC
jgi:hypothetical protein